MGQIFLYESTSSDKDLILDKEKDKENGLKIAVDQPFNTINWLENPKGFFCLDHVI